MGRSRNVSRRKPLYLGNISELRTENNSEGPTRVEASCLPCKVVGEALSLSASPASLLTLSSVRLPQMQEAAKGSAKKEREVIETSRESPHCLLAVGRRPTELCGEESRIGDHCWGLPHAHHWHHPSCH